MISNRLTAMVAKLQLALAFLLFGWAGFFMMDFLLSGVYTWPRVSRALVLIGAALIHSYEFVYKEQRAQMLAEGRPWHPRTLIQVSILPFMIGSLALLAFLHLLSP